MRKTCLLVDDDEDDAEIFSIALNEANPDIKCLTAADGLEALEMLRDPSFIPDYIFLDLNMPLMTGKECLVEIRNSKIRSPASLLFVVTLSNSSRAVATSRSSAR